MDISKLECPSCGAGLKVANGKGYCEYCGREVLIESKTVEEVSKTVSSTIQQTGEKTNEVIKTGSENTQIELRRLQMTQELSTLQMQLSNLRSEKRNLNLVHKKNQTYESELRQIEEDERNVTSRINLVQSTLYSQHGQASINADVAINPWGATKSQSVALLLAVFLGFFGAHRFYSGHTKLGFLYLFTAGVGGIGWAIDILLLGSYARLGKPAT